MATKTMQAGRWELDDGYGYFERLVRDRLATTPGPWLTTDATRYAPTPEALRERRAVYTPAEAATSVLMNDPRVKTAEKPLYTGLYDVFLAALPADRRQHYNCAACRRFMDQVGGLVAVTAEGLEPVAWGLFLDNVPAFFSHAVEAVRQRVLKARVTGVFVSPQETLGTPEAGGWTHLSGPNPLPFTPRMQTAEQRAAELYQDYTLVSRTLAEFPEEVIGEAVRVLEADALARSEKALGAARWLHNLKLNADRVKGNFRNARILAAVAVAPAGVAHARNNMIGTLLDDIKSGLPYEAVRRRWAEKMDPGQYQRPTALKEGNVAEAERLFAALDPGARSLNRRFANLDDVPEAGRVWVPKVVPAQAGAPAESPFARLRERVTDKPTFKRLELPAKAVSWKRFREDTLPAAERLHYWVPRHGNFVALVTAADPDAPPVVQWDDPKLRNPVTWYVYKTGSPAAQWNLRANGWAEVTLVCRKPCHWPNTVNHQFRQFSESAILLLKDCRDTKHEGGGGLFPELIRAEFYKARAAIEAHMATAKLGNQEAATACGVVLDADALLPLRPFYSNSAFGPARLKATVLGVETEWLIDRWE